MRTSCLILVALSAGCLRGTQFVCESDAQCGVDGRCEPAHFCSFADSACGTGRRFGDAAGALSNTCVGDDGGVDAAVDTPPPDPDAIDAPEDKCSGYTALAGTPATQKYKLVTTPLSNWDNAQNLCVADHPGSSYLAIPDDDTELTALSTLTALKYWIGVTDKGNEGTFLNVKDQPAFTKFGAGEPNDQGNQDCVSVFNGNMLTDKCGSTQAAYICECDDI